MDIFISALAHSVYEVLAQVSSKIIIHDTHCRNFGNKFSKIIFFYFVLFSNVIYEFDSWVQGLQSKD